MARSIGCWAARRRRSSGGPRVCLGNLFAMMEAQVILATMARHVRLDLVVAGLPAWEPLITLRPKAPVEMRVSRRG